MGAEDSRIVYRNKAQGSFHECVPTPAERSNLKNLGYEGVRRDEIEAGLTKARDQRRPQRGGFTTFAHESAPKD